MKTLRNAACLLLASAGAALAQEALPAADPAASAALAAGPTFEELFRAGGWIMWVLAGLSVLALANVAWLLLTLRRGVTAPRAVVHDVTDKLRQGDLDEARKALADMLLDKSFGERSAEGNPFGTRRCFLP